MTNAVQRLTRYRLAPYTFVDLVQIVHSQSPNIVSWASYTGTLVLKITDSTVALTVNTVSMRGYKPTQSWEPYDPRVMPLVKQAIFQSLKEGTTRGAQATRPAD